MRSALFLSFFLPLVLGCDNPSDPSHSCAAVYTASSAVVNEFCATFTTATVTATTGLPTWASACDNEPKKLSSACSCLATAWTTAAPASATATESSSVADESGCPALDETTSTTSVVAASTSTSAPTSLATAVVSVSPSSTSTSSSAPTTLVTAVASTSKSSASTSTSSSTTLASTVASTSKSSASSSTSSSTTLGTSVVSTSTTSTSTSVAEQTTSSAVSVASEASITTEAVASATGSACVVTEYASISSAVASCTNIVLSNIYAPASSTINLKSLQTGTTVTFAGTTTFGDTYDDSFDPIIISGTNVLVTGAEGHVIDGNGQAYWDGEGSNGGQSKPDHFIVVKDFYDSSITNLNIQNWPVHCFEIEDVKGVTISGLLLNNTAGDEPNDLSGSDPAAHNTDGFDISKSTSVTLLDNTVYNQDDCVAVTSGVDIVVSGMYCSGGHGLSIGSVGGKSNNTVDKVTFENSQVVNSQNGCRIKSNADTTGSITNIIYQNITVSEISDYGIDVQQDYLNGGPTGDPTNGVTISGVSFIDITGTATSDGMDYYILCGDGSCSDFTLTDVSITGGGKTSSCNYPSSGCP